MTEKIIGKKTPKKAGASKNPQLSLYLTRQFLQNNILKSKTPK